jgi:hypothetical protein
MSQITETQLHAIAIRVMDSIDPSKELSLDDFITDVPMNEEQLQLCHSLISVFMNHDFTYIGFGSKWMAMVDMSITIGSHTRNPNGTSLHIPFGTILKWEDDAPNGNVWFNTTIDGENYRGKIESGKITNLIRRGSIAMVQNGSTLIYGNPYLQKLLAD